MFRPVISSPPVLEGQRFSQFAHPTVTGMQSDDSVVRLGFLRLLLSQYGVRVLVELHRPETFQVIHIMSKYLTPFYFVY